MFEYHTTVTLRDTDAFGLIYFTEQLNYCSEAFQAFLIDRGTPMPAETRDAPFVLPVVHCQSDFTKPLRLNDKVVVTIDSIEHGNSSLTLSYSVHCKKQQVGSATTTHVCVNTQSGTSMPLPQPFKELLI